MMISSNRYRVPGAYDVPETAEERSWKVNIEQMIWGHRLVNDQSSWLLLLETIAIMASRASDKNLDTMFACPGQIHESFSYSVQTRRRLRSLLFQDHGIDHVARHGDDLSDEAKWSKWIGGRNPDAFAYLRKNFNSFNDFYDAVDLLRAAVVEPERDRRTTSRHLVPGGVDMIMADYAATASGGINNDRRFFARGGELVFLMLGRSRHAEKLEALIRKRLLTNTSRWNKVAKLLQPDEDSDSVAYKIGYLPLKDHRIYDKLAEDWLALLSLEQLPDDQLTEPLMRLTGLHVVRYIIERSAEVLGRKIDQPIPIDMSTTSAAGLRRVSRERFQLHKEMSRLAISKVVDDFANGTDWLATAEFGDPIAYRKNMIRDVFSHQIDPKTLNPEDMIEEVRDAALTKHANHLGQVIGVLADQIGLGVARPGQGRWYAANNGFLEAVVLANVTAPVELEQYLWTLWQKYNFVIGTTVGRDQLGEGAPFEQLKSNQRIFEERLRMLGFVERLSDDCAFVRNPYQ